MKKEIHSIWRIAGFLLLCVSLTFCQRETKTEEVNLTLDQTLGRNPAPSEIGRIPEATVKLLKLSEVLSLKADEIPATLTPSTFEATLNPGESGSESKTATVSSAPPQGDILFMFDLTGSMYGELSNVKVNSNNIMVSVSTVIPDAAFGLATHMDYTGTYNYCDYYSTYGSASYGDYPYMLDQAITTDQVLVSSAINSKGLGNGNDYPEDYARILYETTADPSIAWRSGARRFVVAWLDAPPHDCALGYGVDPGRDEVAGTEDDLTMAAALAAMADQNITLIVLYSGESEYFDDWQNYALATGGVAYQIYYDGSIPGGIDIADYITGIIQEETGMIDELTLAVCTEGYEGWLTDLNPASFTSVDLATPFTGGFDVTYTVPEGTEGGIHEFDVCLIGDGAVYARQHVIITVPSGGTTMQVPVDILPRVCPNLISRFKALPLAILGFEGLDVMDIDPSTVRLEGIGGSVEYIKDVSGPYYPFIGKPLDYMSCNLTKFDGFADLNMKFDIRKVLSAYEIGDVLRLTLTGNLMDGTPFVGEDIIVIYK